MSEDSELHLHGSGVPNKKIYRWWLVFTVGIKTMGWFICFIYGKPFFRPSDLVYDLFSHKVAHRINISGKLKSLLWKLFEKKREHLPLLVLCELGFFCLFQYSRNSKLVWFRLNSQKKMYTIFYYVFEIYYVF